MISLTNNHFLVEGSCLGCYNMNRRLIKHSGLKKEVNGPVLAQARQGYRRDGTTTEIAINKDSVEEHS